MLSHAAISAVIIALFAQQPDPLALLNNVERARTAIRTGRLQMRYAETFDNRPLRSCELTAYFKGPRLYAMEVSRHTYINAPWNRDKVPQCAQIFDGEKIIGMWYSGETPSYEIRAEGDARFQMFNPYYLGVASYPLPGSDPSRYFYWHNDSEFRYLGTDPNKPERHLVEVRATGPQGSWSVAVFTIDAARGWNIVRCTFDNSSGYHGERTCELRQFGDVWFPRSVVMTQREPQGSTWEFRVDVLEASFNMDIPDAHFTWQKLDPPVRTPILDYRSGGSAGNWNGQRVVSSGGAGLPPAPRYAATTESITAGPWLLAAFAVLIMLTYGIHYVRTKRAANGR